MHRQVIYNVYNYSSFLSSRHSLKSPELSKICRLDAGEDMMIPLVSISGAVGCFASLPDTSPCIQRNFMIHPDHIYFHTKEACCCYSAHIPS